MSSTCGTGGLADTPACIKICHFTISHSWAAGYAAQADIQAQTHQPEDLDQPEYGVWDGA
jgi:hypothetical protein